MRKIIISFIVLFAAISLNAQAISGIRVDGGDSPILVYIGGSQMCSATTSCFVANLKAGNYIVQVYATRYTRPGERVTKGALLYNERVNFSGKGVKDIYVENRSGGGRPVGRPNQGNRYPDRETNDRLMSAKLFESFYNTLSKEINDGDRIRMIGTTVLNSDFTSEQCLRLVKLFRFDGDKVTVMKRLYPVVTDKQAFFTVLGTLTYSDNKTKMNEFIRDYNSNN